jgi:winged helix DNA-binding protein
MSAVQEQARWWSYGRQRLGRQAPDAEEALRGVVGVYSAHPTGPLSLHARAKSFGEHSFRRLETERLALRVPAMRTSIHIVPRQTAHLVFWATHKPMSQQSWRIRDAGISEDEYDQLRSAILRVARRPRTARELREDLGGTETSLTPVLQTMTFEGVLLRVGAESLRSNVLRYVAADAWLERGLPKADPHEALAWLAGEYLRAFGPARPEDFQWWAGRAARGALDALTSVEAVEIGDGYLLPAADLEDFERAVASPGNSVNLLPKWDCYTMGYAPDGRQRFVHPDVQDRIYDADGNGLGVVLVDGTAVGAWSARLAGRRMEVELDMFERPGARLKRAVAERFEAVAALLGTGAVSLH